MTFGRVGAWFGTLTAGSLLRRTLLSVGAFVIGSAAFVTLASVILVSVVRGVFPPHGSGSSSHDEADTAATTKGGSKTLKTKKARGADEAPPKSGSDESE